MPYYFDITAPFNTLLESLRALLQFPLSLTTLEDTDSDATSVDDARSGATTVYMVEVDNRLNNAITYTKLYNNAGPTVGTTVPNTILMCPASSRKIYLFPGGIPFATALSYASVTGAGTAGTTNPTNDVIVRIACS